MSLDIPLTGPVASGRAGEGPEWSLRRAVPGDAASLALVGRATFLDTYAGYLPGPDIVRHCAERHAEALYARWTGARDHAVWLVEAAGSAPIGYQVVSPPDMAPFAARSDDLELKRIYLLSRHHGGGAGAAMMDAALGWARSAGAGRLLVALWEENRRAMAFYRRVGFVPVGTRPFTVGAQTYTDPVLTMDLA